MTPFNDQLAVRREEHQAPRANGTDITVELPMDVSVVMPCLNEEAAVARCVETALTSLSQLGLSGEVVVVDNDSEDRSAGLAASAGARVVHEPLRGYGRAYQRGLAEAEGQLLMMGDSDGTYDFSALPKFVEPLLNGTDMVMGSRLRGVIDHGAMPWLHRYVGNPALTKTMRTLFPSEVSDVYCGMRAVKRDVLARMELTAPGMEFALEMIVEAHRLGARIEEVPIRYGRRIGGTPKLRTWRDGWSSFRFIVAESRSTSACRGASPAYSEASG